MSPVVLAIPGIRTGKSVSQTFTSGGIDSWVFTATLFFGTSIAQDGTIVNPTKDGSVSRTFTVSP